MKTLLPVLALVTALLSSAPCSGFQRLNAGDNLADFALVDFEGRVVRLSESLGAKATVLAFWTTWSPRSGEALAVLQDLFRTRGPADLRVIAVNLEHEHWEPGEFERVAGHVAKSRLTFPIVVDFEMSLYERYGITVLPSLVLADGRGRVVETLSGYPEPLREGFWAAVRTALGEPAPARESANN